MKIKNSRNEVLNNIYMLFSSMQITCVLQTCSMHSDIHECLPSDLIQGTHVLRSVSWICFILSS